MMTVALIALIDSFLSFNKLSIKSVNDNWYVKSFDGKHIYRYFESNGTAHWAGSTGDKLAPLKVNDIPKEIIRAFSFNPKGK